jgi:hypothetical protein
VQFKPFTGKLLMRGYEPWAGGLLDDQLPLTWTQVQVTLKEPNVVTMREIRAGEEEMVSDLGSEPLDRLKPMRPSMWDGG